MFYQIIIYYLSVTSHRLMKYKQNIFRPACVNMSITRHTALPLFHDLIPNNGLWFIIQISRWQFDKVDIFLQSSQDSWESWTRTAPYIAQKLTEKSDYTLNTLDSIYMTSNLYVQCLQINLNNDGNGIVQCANKPLWPLGLIVACGWSVLKPMIT